MTTGHAKPFVPFADDSASLSLGKLTVENGRDRIALYGSMDITRDQGGLQQALALKQLIDGVVTALQGDAALPGHAAADLAPKTVPNPFA